MDNVKNNYEKVVAIAILSATIAGFIVYRYFFSRRIDDEKRCEKDAEQLERGLTVESDSRSLSEGDVRVQSTLEERASASQPAIRSRAKGSIQLAKKPQRTAEDQKNTDEIDVEFSPAKSPVSGIDYRPIDDSMQLSRAQSSQTPQRGESTADSMRSPPLKEKSMVNVYYCNCDQIFDSSSITEDELSGNVKVALMPTKITPIRFDCFTPTNLTEMEEMGDMSDNSLNEPHLPTNHRIIIPFLPTLHTIAYVSKHIELLNQLAENYQYYERNYND